MNFLLMLGAQSNSVDCTITDDTSPDNVKATPTNTENEVTLDWSLYAENISQFSAIELNISY